MSKYHELLKKGDLRSTGNVDKVIALIKSQEDFDELFSELTGSDRKVVMRAADAIEKITIQSAGYLQKHKKQILTLCQNPSNIELKWHLALIVSRVRLTEKEFGATWTILSNWAKERKESRIVRVNSLQGLYTLLQQKPELSRYFNLILAEVEKENIPSINARIKQIKRQAAKKL